MAKPRKRPLRQRRMYSKSARKRWSLALVAVVLAAGVVLVLAGFAGKWMAENWVAPVLNLFAANPSPTLATNATVAPALSPQATPSVSQGAATATGGKVQEEVTVEAVQVTCVQMGIFTVRENAQAAAQSNSQRGGAGFVLQTDSQYRVLAAGYETEAQAQNVRDNLLAQGESCLLYTLECPSVALRITATQERLSALTGTFDDYHTARVRCLDMALSIDGGGALPEQVREQVQRDAQTMAALRAALPASGEDGIASALADMLEQAQTALEKLARVSSEALSASLKHAHLQLTQLYVDFARQVQTI